MNSGARCTPGSQEMLAPEPGRDSIVHQPPAICARSRLAVNRIWPGTDPHGGSKNVCEQSFPDRVHEPELTLAPTIGIASGQTRATCKRLLRDLGTITSCSAGVSGARV